MKSDEKNTIPRARIAILGSSNVGKSALTVRYLTRRFIGEYRSNIDLLYKKVIPQDNGLIEIEIIDVFVENKNDIPIEQIQWCDACMIVYSITDRSSFEYACKLLCELKSVPNSPLTYLLANKSELEHFREVNENEGSDIAKQQSIEFFELSAAKNSPELYKAFQKLITDCRSQSGYKLRKFSVSRMIGNLMGTNNNNGNNYNINKQSSINQGTVVPCHRSDLLKNRLPTHKRRQQFKASISL